ncbi:hypothetical protein KA005_39635 [bacterium]|nr:hypothetical protein [bacterium]
MSESKRPLIYYKILQYQDENLELLNKHLLLEYAKTHNNLLITPHIGSST